MLNENHLTFCPHQPFWWYCSRAPCLPEPINVDLENICSCSLSYNFPPSKGIYWLLLTPVKSIELRCPFKSWWCMATCFCLIFMILWRTAGGERSGERSVRKLAAAKYLICQVLYGYVSAVTQNKWGHVCVLFNESAAPFFFCGKMIRHTVNVTGQTVQSSWPVHWHWRELIWCHVLYVSVCSTDISFWERAEIKTKWNEFQVFFTGRLWTLLP